MIEDKSKPIIDQEQLVERITRIVLKDAKTTGRGRPRGFFLIAGTVDSNAIARRVARSIFHDSEACLRIDLSDYSERHQLLGLIGMNGGISCSHFDGALTAPISDRPSSVVMLHNIDRATPDFYHLLHEVLIEGKCPDYLRGSVGFEETVILATLADPASVEKRLSPEIRAAVDELFVL
jgi:ATP-dependent Clp protease ATP-binding subunit ClpA